MWKHQLVDLRQRAVRRMAAPRPSTVAPPSWSSDQVQTAIHAVARQPTTAASLNARTPQTSMLAEASDALHHTFGQLRFQDRLNAASGQHAQAFTTADVLQWTEEYNMNDAVEAVAVLLRAGMVSEAQQCMSMWRGGAEEPTTADGGQLRWSLQRARAHRRRALHRASSKLHQLITDLAAMDDATTLREVFDHLDTAHHEEASSSSSCTNPLFGALGAQRLQHLRTSAAVALCRLPPSSGITTIEKLHILRRCTMHLHTAPTTSSSTTSSWRSIQRPQKKPVSVLPLSLQRVFSEVVEEEPHYSADLLRHTAPELAEAFRHPSTYPLEALMRLPTAEILDVARTWDSASTLLHPSSSSSSTTTKTTTKDVWQKLSRLVPHRTSEWRKAELNACLANLVHQQQHHHRRRRWLSSLRSRGSTRALTPAERGLRHELITMLRTPTKNPSWLTNFLMAKPSMLAALHISPLIVMGVGLQACRTNVPSNTKRGMATRHARKDEDAAQQLRPQVLMPVVQRLCASSLHHMAAHLVWNHFPLSPSHRGEDADAICPPHPHTHRAAYINYLRRHPLAVDRTVMAMCRTMRAETQDVHCGGSNAKTWMAYRSLDVLQAMAPTGIIDTTHLVPVCVAALHLGLPFAAVEQTMREWAVRASRDDAPTADVELALDLIRICEGPTRSSPPTRLHLHPHRRSFCQTLRGWLRGGTWMEEGSRTRRSLADGPLTLPAPTRSQQLALWSVLQNEKIHPTLQALILSLYFRPATREAFLRCAHLDANKTNVVHDGERSAAPTKTELLAQFFTLESAASIASNCTSERSMEVLLRGLHHRHAVMEELHGALTHQESSSSAVEEVRALAETHNRNLLHVLLSERTSEEELNSTWGSH